MECSALPQQALSHTRYYNSFRGKPAISALDKPFTPILSSSKPIATDTGSGLLLRVSKVHPGQE